MIKAWAFRNSSPSALAAHGYAPLYAMVVAGLGLAGLALLTFSDILPAFGDVALVGLLSATLLAAAGSLLPLFVQSGATADTILLLGREDLAAELGGDLLRNHHVVGLGKKLTREAPDPEEGAPPAMTLGPAQLKELVQKESISRIVVLEPDLESRKEIGEALLECRLLGVPVEDGIELYQRLHGKLWLEAFDPARLAFADGFRITPGYRAVKRVIDVSCASVLLVLAAPLILVIAAAIKLDSPGPVLFRQRRVGQFGKTFTLLKFRSMRQDAEKDGPAWAQKDDDRATRIGRFLRKTHLDEIPQGWNVLKGDLSIVGPRPERPCFVEMLCSRIPYFDLRLYVKPGITGWAQVRCPYADSVEDSYEKLQHDLYYARIASPLLDLEILFRTALVMVTGNGR